MRQCLWQDSLSFGHLQLSNHRKKFFYRFNTFTLQYLWADNRSCPCPCSCSCSHAPPASPAKSHRCAHLFNQLLFRQVAAHQYSTLLLAIMYSLLLAKMLRWLITGDLCCRDNGCSHTVCFASQIFADGLLQYDWWASLVK